MNEDLTMRTLFILFISFNPITIFADCNYGDCNSGYGSATFPKGDVYVGDWKNGKAQGKGILKYKDGNTYFGDWREGKANGYGVMEYSNGNRYKGEWKDSEAHGNGTLFDKEGKIIFSGKWFEGKMLEEVVQTEKNLAQKDQKN